MFEALKTSQGWWKHHSEVYAMLGIRGSVLPPEGFGETTVSGVTFICKPARASAGGRKHRLFVVCPCGKDVPFGRMHQHTRGPWHVEANALARELERDPDCLCVPHTAHPTDISPPEGDKLNPNCPVHGRDPDEAYDRMRDERLERDFWNAAEDNG